MPSLDLQDSLFRTNRGRRDDRLRYRVEWRFADFAPRIATSESDLLLLGRRVPVPTSNWRV